jgi:hypothetical protein
LPKIPHDKYVEKEINSHMIAKGEVGQGGDNGEGMPVARKVEQEEEMGIRGGSYGCQTHALVLMHFLVFLEMI